MRLRFGIGRDGGGLVCALVRHAVCGGVTILYTLSFFFTYNATSCDKRDFFFHRDVSPDRTFACKRGYCISAVKGGTLMCLLR